MLEVLGFINSDFTDAKIIDEEGVSIMYDSSLHDLVNIEEELIKIWTFYIQKQEYLIDVEVKEPVFSIDRGAVWLELLKMNTSYSLQKLDLSKNLRKFMNTHVTLLNNKKMYKASKTKYWLNSLYWFLQIWN